MGRKKSENIANFVQLSMILDCYSSLILIISVKQDQ